MQKNGFRWAMALGIGLLCLFGLSACGDSPSTPQISLTGIESEEPSTPSVTLTPDTAGPMQKSAYGVFIGVNPEQAEILRDYAKVVIDAEYFSADQIAAIKQTGTSVYSYLNIGSIETFRGVYPKFKTHTLGKYEDWPGEFWMDVSTPAWQKYVATAARTLVAKGVDGFFLDNADVYYNYHQPAILKGLITIIDDLETLNVVTLINGGDVFITEAILETATPEIHITGINQETVFSGIDFDNKKLIVQSAEDTTYFKDYLAQCEKAGLKIYLTEYVEANNADLRQVINDYCKEHGYNCYIASSIDLDG